MDLGWRTEDRGEKQKNLEWAKKLLPPIPESVATIEDAYQIPQGSSPSETIILIQDAHTNSSCQLNESKLFDILFTKRIEDRGLRIEETSLHPPSSILNPVVFTEAAQGNVNLTFLRDKASLFKRKQIANEYLQKGLLHGIEYLDLTSDHTFKIEGVEDPTLYFKSLEVYKASVKKRDSFERYLTEIESTISVLKSKLLNPFLLSFLDKKDKQKDNLSDYIQTLTTQAQALNLDLSKYPNLKQLQTLKALESKIDFKQASLEQQEAVKALSPEDQKELSEVSISKLNMKDSQRGFFLLLEEKLMKIEDKPLPQSSILHPQSNYPNLSKYFKYLDQSKSLNPKDLLVEQKELESQVLKGLTTNEDEEKLLLSIKTLEYYKKLFFLTLTPEEYQESKNQKFTDLKVLSGFLNQKLMHLKDHYDKAIFLKEDFTDVQNLCTQFYELTYQRDQKFIENIQREWIIMDRGSRIEDRGKDSPPSSILNPRSRLSVLITGGYHTPNLKYLLKKHNISYISITPQVTHETNTKRYEEILLNQPIPNFVSIAKPTFADVGFKALNPIKGPAQEEFMMRFDVAAPVLGAARLASNTSGISKSVVANGYPVGVPEIAAARMAVPGHTRRKFLQAGMALLMVGLEEKPGLSQLQKTPEVVDVTYIATQHETAENFKQYEKDLEKAKKEAESRGKAFVVLMENSGPEWISGVPLNRTVIDRMKEENSKAKKLLRKYFDSTISDSKKFLEELHSGKAHDLDEVEHDFGRAFFQWANARKVTVVYENPDFEIWFQGMEAQVLAGEIQNLFQNGQSKTDEFDQKSAGLLASWVQMFKSRDAAVLEQVVTLTKQGKAVGLLYGGAHIGIFDTLKQKGVKVGKGSSSLSQEKLFEANLTSPSLAAAEIANGKKIEANERRMIVLHSITQRALSSFLIVRNGQDISWANLDLHNLISRTARRWSEDDTHQLSLASAENKGEVPMLFIETWLRKNGSEEEKRLFLGPKKKAMEEGHGSIFPQPHDYFPASEKRILEFRERINIAVAARLTRETKQAARLSSQNPSRRSVLQATVVLLMGASTTPLGDALFPLQNKKSDSEEFKQLLKDFEEKVKGDDRNDYTVAFQNLEEYVISNDVSGDGIREVFSILLKGIRHQNEDMRTVTVLMAPLLNEAAGEKFKTEAIKVLTTTPGVGIYERDGYTRWQAFSALATVGGEEALSIFKKELKSMDPESRSYAASQIGGLHHIKRDEIIAALTDEEGVGFHDLNFQIQSVAAYTIGSLGGPEAKRVLDSPNRGINDEVSESVRRASVRGLIAGVENEHEDLRSVVSLLTSPGKGLRDPIHNTRLETAKGFRIFSTEQVIAALFSEGVGINDPSELVRIASAETAAEIFIKVPGLLTSERAASMFRFISHPRIETQGVKSLLGYMAG